MLDDAFKLWQTAAPMSEVSRRLFEAIEAAREDGRSEMGAWIAFFRSLTEEQQQAVLAMLEAIGPTH